MAVACRSASCAAESAYRRWKAEFRLQPHKGCANPSPSPYRKSGATAAGSLTDRRRGADRGAVAADRRGSIEGASLATHLEVEENGRADNADDSENEDYM